MDKDDTDFIDDITGAPKPPRLFAIEAASQEFGQLEVRHDKWRAKNIPQWKGDVPELDFSLLRTDKMTTDQLASALLMLSSITSYMKSLRGQLNVEVTIALAKESTIHDILKATYATKTKEWIRSTAELSTARIRRIELESKLADLDGTIESTTSLYAGVSRVVELEKLDHERTSRGDNARLRPPIRRADRAFVAANSLKEKK